MRRSNWLIGLRASLGRSRNSCARTAKWRPTASRRPKFEPLEDRHLLALDYGDAPDSALGSGPGNYNTRTADNGPSHTVVEGLKLGANVDGDDGTLQNVAANADDANGRRRSDPTAATHSRFPSPTTLRCKRGFASRSTLQHSEVDVDGYDELQRSREQQDESETVDALDLAFANL